MSFFSRQELYVLRITDEHDFIEAVPMYHTGKDKDPNENPSRGAMAHVNMSGHVHTPRRSSFPSCLTEINLLRHDSSAQPSSDRYRNALSRHSTT